MHRNVRIAVAIVFVGLFAGAGSAQQVTGTLGSPSATTTIDGKQLPAPDPKFGGKIEQDALKSKPGGRRASCRRSPLPTCC